MMDPGGFMSRAGRLFFWFGFWVLAYMAVFRLVASRKGGYMTLYRAASTPGSPRRSSSVCS
jgi:hypothetical protein